MPLRPMIREQAWLLPPSLEELVPEDHPARFVAAVVDGLDRAGWQELGIVPEGEALGAPAYHPRVLLGVWLYGFLTGVRSSRKLETACREHLPYLWLTGWQRPDHNTLWRFYQAHRAEMRRLLKRTVRAAVRLGLVDLAVQAVDGTKVGANAANDRSLDAAGLAQLLERTDAAIADLEAQNATGGDRPPPRLPARLARARRLRERVAAALAEVAAPEGPTRRNVTDPEARWMGKPGDIRMRYNAQAMVAPLDSAAAGGTGLVVTAATVTQEANDAGQLVPVLAEAEDLTGQPAELTLADTGYYSGPNLQACAAQERAVAIPVPQPAQKAGPYAIEAFVYTAATDTYCCPQGHTLRFVRLTPRGDGRPPAREYGGIAATCRACPAFGTCTTSRQRGRTLKVPPSDPVAQAHRARMATPEVQTAYRRRKELVEPAFGIFKECQAARRFLLRGLVAVTAEWHLLATAFNLRTLWRVWQRRARPERSALVAALTA